MQQGVNLRQYDDSTEFELVDEISLDGNGHLPLEVKKSIILDKAEGISNHIIAIRYDTRPDTVARIWKEFVNSTVGVRHIADEGPAEFKTRVRHKAITAIVNGLECERDPYRQAAVGVNVMKGIGEFANESHSSSLKVNVLVNGVPNEWKGRYIGIGTPEEGGSNGK